MNSTGGVSVADLRDHIAARTAGLKVLHASVFQCPTGQLGEFLGELAELRALAGAATAVVAADAECRGVVGASQSASTRGWIAEYGWHSCREASSIAKAARILIGSTAAPRTTTTPPCSADGTTPSSTATTCMAKSLQDRQSGTADQAPTDRRNNSSRPAAPHRTPGRFPDHAEHRHRCGRERKRASPPTRALLGSGQSEPDAHLAR